MFKVLVNKKNNKELLQFIIPKNEGYNCKSWILVTIISNVEFKMERFNEEIVIQEDEWELKTNYAFPSALMTEFLRFDFNDDDFLTYLK
jgi:hypothetical protein